ncbi:uncharacterized protein LOC144120006 [Amblyomma americanum]
MAMSLGSFALIYLLSLDTAPERAYERYDFSTARIFLAYLEQRKRLKKKKFAFLTCFACSCCSLVLLVVPDCSLVLVWRDAGAARFQFDLVKPILRPSLSPADYVDSSGSPGNVFTEGPCDSRSLMNASWASAEGNARRRKQF